MTRRCNLLHMVCARGPAGVGAPHRRRRIPPSDMEDRSTMAIQELLVYRVQGRSSDSLAIEQDGAAAAFEAVFVMNSNGGFDPIYNSTS